MRKELKKEIATTLCILITVAGTAKSDITWDTGPGSGNVHIDPTLVPGTSNDYVVNVSLLANGTGAFGLDADNPNDRIVELIFDNNPNFTTNSYIYSIRDVDVDPDFPADLAALLNVTVEAGAQVRASVIHLTGDLGQNINGDRGYLKFGGARFVTVLGDWYADMYLDADVVTVSDPEIRVFGDMRGGSFYCEDSKLILFNVAGDMGNIFTTGNITHIWAEEFIDRVVAGSISNMRFPLYDPVLFQPTPRDVNLISVFGDFISSHASEIGQLGGLSGALENNPGGLDINGSCSVELDIIDSIGIKNPTTEVFSLYRIGDSLLSNAIISLPADGLTTQIIINDKDVSGDWLGDIIIGTATLAPNYTQLSSELGGGQVGVAPFNFHQRTTAPLSGNDEDKDCDPHQSEVKMAAYDSGEGKNEVISARIRHYGPVYADGTGPHFRVEFKSDLLPSSWVDRTSLFEINTSYTGTSALTADRDVVIKGTAFNGNGFTAAGKWRIRPIDTDPTDPDDGKVKCGDVTGNPDVAWDSNVTSGDLGATTGTQYDWYQFRVLLEAPGGGMLLDGGTSASDLTSWGVAPYEVNADGETDSQDFSELVDSYSGS